MEEHKYFIENRKAGYIESLLSKGTNYSCYEQYISKLDDEDKIESKIDTIRTIVYAIHQPFLYTFFYWTILIFILHKFNFKNKILKIILLQFILRCIGDVINRFGELMPHYYATKEIIDNEDIVIGYDCEINSSDPERHPLRWFLTRQIGTIFWYVGEIFADWYPLIRTREIVKTSSSIWFVYVTCILFNMSKIALIILHFTLSPNELYRENGVYDIEKVDMFYFKYWAVQLIIIYSSVIYDFSVYHVLKKYSFQINISQISFVHKFKTFSIYRIRVTLLISIIFLPIVSIAIMLKFYYYYNNNYHKLEFSFDEIRRSIANMQYFIIFIDQILLSYSDHENMDNARNYPETNTNLRSNSATSLNNYNYNNNSNKFFYKHLNGSNSSLGTLTNNNNNNNNNITNNNYNNYLFGNNDLNNINFGTLNSNYSNLSSNISHGNQNKNIYNSK